MTTRRKGGPPPEPDAAARAGAAASRTPASKAKTRNERYKPAAPSSHIAPRREVLADHIRKGKKRTPEWLQLLRNTGSPSIDWRWWGVPELLWIDLIREHLGPLEALSCTNALLSAARAHASPKDRPVLCFASAFQHVPAEARADVRRSVSIDVLARLGEALEPVRILYPSWPLAWLSADASRPSEAAREQAGYAVIDAVLRLLDRRGMAATMTQAVAMLALHASGELNGPQLFMLDDLRDYPTSEVARKAAGTVRAGLNAFLAEVTNSDWARAFWMRGKELGPCVLPDDDRSPPPLEQLQAANVTGTRFARAAFAEVAQLTARLPLDASNPHRESVLAALLQRQVQFAADFCRNPLLWQQPWSQMGLRSMAETLIRLRWLVAQDQVERYAEFVDYGLGQEKLHIEHLRAVASSGAANADVLREEAAEREAWLVEQKFERFQEVDLGVELHGKNLRDLAMETGSSELRNLVFQPLSGTVHGLWQAVARQNLHVCLNPLHGGHLVAHEHARPIVSDVAVRAVDLYADSFACLAALTGEATLVSPAVRAWRAEFPGSWSGDTRSAPEHQPGAPPSEDRRQYADQPDATRPARKRRRKR